MHPAWIVAVSIAVLSLLQSTTAQPITGDLSVSSSLTISPSSPTSGQSVNVGFTVQNLGPGRGQLTRYEILVDGVVRASAQPLTIFPSPGNSMTYSGNVPMPTVAAGSSRAVEVAVQIFGDTNTSNNRVSRFVTVSGPPRPDLACTTPAGWSGAIVVSNVMGTTTSMPNIPSGSSVFVDVAWRNGGGSTTGGIQVEVLLDGAVVFNTPFPPLESGLSRTRLDIPLGTVAAGDHVITLRLDGDGFIQESNESNNTCAIGFTVTSVNLAPFTPPGWASALIISNEPNSMVPVTSIRAGETAYVDVAYRNGGTGSAGAFQVRAVVNGSQVDIVDDSGLSAMGERALADVFVLNGLLAGPQMLRIELDPLNQISEANETDNTVQAIFNVEPVPCVADFDNSGSVTVQDIFDFLAAYFGNDSRADVNGIGGISVQDIFDFLSAYFTGCP